MFEELSCCVNFFYGPKALLSLSLFCEIPETHSHTKHSVGLFCTTYSPIQRPLPDNSQHSEEKRTSIHPRDSNP